MKKLLPLLLIFCMLLTACTPAGNAPTTVNDTPNNNAAEPPASANAEDAPETPDAPEEPFSIYPAYLILPLGQHLTMDASAAPEGKALTWTSSDTSVATVDENGRITPIAEGETIITAALADDAGVSSSCGVLVSADGNIFMWDDEE